MGDVVPPRSVSAYLFITVPANNSGDVVKVLTTSGNIYREVVRATAVYGECDIVAKVTAESLQDLHDLVMNRIQKINAVASTRTLIMIPEQSAKGVFNEQPLDVRAYLRISVPAGKSAGLVKRLTGNDFPEIIEAAAVYGEADVVARVGVTSLEELRGLVMDRIQLLSEVRVTRTHIEILRAEGYQQGDLIA
jgi:DNA-binding Lrp family transcriptional regulator